MTDLTQPSIVGLAVDLAARHHDRGMNMTRLDEEYRADLVSVPVSTFGQIRFVAARRSRRKDARR